MAPSGDAQGPPESRARGRRGAGRSLIELRRFAGPEAHVEMLDHVRVAHLTDLHFGRVTPERVQRAAVSLVNQQKPDVVVLTGDFVCHGHGYLDQLSGVLADLDAPAIGVLGNHDYWSGADEVERALHRAGVEVLHNAHTTITVRHQPLQIVGLDDAYTGHADRAKATKGLRADVATIGLSHIGEEADALWRLGVPLVLAGHTHAGQVTLARLHEIAIGKIAGHKYVHGLYGARAPNGNGPNGALYVGAGIGAAVFPLRLGERGRREAAIFELGQSIGAFEEHHAEQRALTGRPPSPATAERRRAVMRKKAERRRAARGPPPGHRS